LGSELGSRGVNAREIGRGVYRSIPVGLTREQESAYKVYTLIHELLLKEKYV